MGGYTIEWSWADIEKWRWYDETFTIWGAIQKIKKSKKFFTSQNSNVIGVYNRFGQKLNRLNDEIFKEV